MPILIDTLIVIYINKYIRYLPIFIFIILLWLIKNVVSFNIFFAWTIVMAMPYISWFSCTIFILYPIPYL